MFNEKTLHTKDQMLNSKTYNETVGNKNNRGTSVRPLNRPVRSRPHTFVITIIVVVIRIDNKIMASRPYRVGIYDHTSYEVY